MSAAAPAAETVHGTPPDIVIDVHGLTKSFAGRIVVRDLSMQVKRGTIFGFLGPNGSGKTTTIRMLCGLLTPDAGRGSCLGFDLRTETSRIKLGHCVTKGSRGIRIWARRAPSRKRTQEWRNAGWDPDELPRATCKLVSVFAQDQVAPLPPPAKPVPLTVPIAEITGDSHEHLFARIIRLADELGYTVCVCDTGPADGTCNRKIRRVEIAERLSANGRLAAAIHELAHALVGADEEAPKLTYAQEELVVESIAWSCC